MRNPWTGRATDHRGKTVPVVQPSHLPPHAPKQVKQAVTTAHSGSWRHALVLTGLAGAALLILDILQAFLFNGGRFFSFGMFWHVLLITFGGLLATLIVGRVEAQHNSKRAVARCLDSGLCPSCAYSLDSIPLDQDAHRTCPECGSIWRAGTHSPAIPQGPRPPLKSQLDATRSRRATPIQQQPATPSQPAHHPAASPPSAEAAPPSACSSPPRPPE